MKHSLPVSGIPPDALLDLIYQHKALRVRQLHLWFAGQQAAVDYLLRRLSLAGRICCDKERAACSAQWLPGGNPASEMAFWALLDFRESVEFQLPGVNGVTIAELSKVFINLSDKDIFLLFSRTARYIAAWEAAVCPALVSRGHKAIQANIQRRQEGAGHGQ